MKFFFAFLIGGIICVIAQLLIDLTPLTPARILVSFVVLGVFLGAVGLYQPLFNLCGCGISIPLIGFGGNIAKGVKEAIDNEGALGIIKGAFSASSIGCTVCICLAFLFSLFLNSKPKRTD